MNPVERAATDLHKYFGLVPRSVEPLDGHAFLVGSNQGEFIFKRHTKLAQSRRAEVERLYIFCGERGFAPRMVKSLTGNVLEGTDSGIISLQHTAPRDGEAPDPERLGVRLGEFHAALAREFPGVVLANQFDNSLKALATAAEECGVDGAAEALARIRPLYAGPVQVVHGDLHPGNILWNQGSCLFIDLDSAVSLPAVSEAGFCAFRSWGVEEHSLCAFASGYRSVVPGPVLETREMLDHAAYHAVQRILFIRIRERLGETHWLADLANQERYLRQAA